ncbi:MAG: OmpA family protein [Nitrospirales bacterium]|nr:OmpA family protein [Nitrospira sp.]MDR4500921.1 OmpA family protein [Nitrospirales bacterium]
MNTPIPRGITTTNTYGMTDLMTSLAMVFILLFSAFITQTSSKAQSTLEEQKDEIQLALRDHLENVGLSLSSDPRDPLTLMIVIPDNLLTFQFGKNTLTPRAEKFLEEAMPFYAATLCGPLRRTIDSLAIQGHTDNQGDDVYNLRLSQERSLAVMVKGLEVIKARKPSVYQCFQELTVASGRGRQDLIYDSNHLVNHEQSRRVIFKIRLRSTEQRQLPQNSTKILTSM